MKIIVLADDFSGASEMGGIGQRYGLSAIVRMDAIDDTGADLVVVDTNTRSLKKNDAIEKTKAIATALGKINQPFRLFKKVDSVMRGHIAAEARVLQKILHYNRILLLPANPSRGRKIVDGHYYVNETPLAQTVFSRDPDFPITTSSVSALVNFNERDLSYTHLQKGNELPSSSFITADVSTKQDIKDYLVNTNDKDLCCGAADCFESWLETTGYTVKQQPRTISNLPFTIMINGSTVRDTKAEEIMQGLAIPQLSLPGRWTEDRFIMEQEEEDLFQQQALSLLQSKQVLSLTIDHPVKQVKDRQDIFSSYFVRLMHYISASVGSSSIHFCLTGGATAFALINSTAVREFYVQKEIAPGIVTLRDMSESKGWFTVKPGSYPWPPDFLKSLAKQ